MKQHEAIAERPTQVLFVCTENSARSIMAEARLNHLGNGRFTAFSAGSRPSAHVHPQALATLNEMAVPTAGLHSKSWKEFSQGREAPLDFVFTLCDRAAEEPCPTWPGQPITAHWSTPDPVIADAPSPQLERHFRDCAIGLRRRIELLLAVPLQSLDAMALAREISAIADQRA